MPTIPSPGTRPVTYYLWARAFQSWCHSIPLTKGICCMLGTGTNLEDVIRSTHGSSGCTWRKSWKIYIFSLKPHRFDHLSQWVLLLGILIDTTNVRYYISTENEIICCTCFGSIVTESWTSILATTSNPKRNHPPPENFSRSRHCSGELIPIPRIFHTHHLEIQVVGLFIDPSRSHNSLWSYSCSRGWVCATKMRCGFTDPQRACCWNAFHCHMDKRDHFI